MAPPLDVRERSMLLSLARRAVTFAANGQPLPSLDLVGESPTLEAPGCSFVTITRRGALRGCIGGLEPRFRLIEDVWEHAYAAAREDPRFPPVGPDELDDVEIEISRLTPAVPLTCAASELPTRLRPGIDGVILQQGLRRATFLPQVWEKVSDPETFLDMLADKAGIPRRAWRQGDVEVLIYQVESFEEHTGTPAA